MNLIGATGGQNSHWGRGRLGTAPAFDTPTQVIFGTAFSYKLLGTAISGFVLVFNVRQSYCARY